MIEHDEATRLSAAVADADHVVVVAGSEFDPKHRSANEVLGQAAGRRAVEGLLGALTPGPGERMDWMMLGGPTLAFLRGRTFVAAVQCVGPDYARCPELWEGDFPLISPAALRSWFDEHSISGAF